MLPVLDRFSFPLCSAQFSVSAVGLTLDGELLLLSWTSEDSIPSSTDLDTFLNLDLSDSKFSGALECSEAAVVVVDGSTSRGFIAGFAKISFSAGIPSQSFLVSLLTFFTFRLSNISETSCKAGELFDDPFSVP